LLEKSGIVTDCKKNSEHMSLGMEEEAREILERHPEEEKEDFQTHGLLNQIKEIYLRN